MTLKEYRLGRLRAEAEKLGADMIIATLQANINYLTSGFVCVGQEVLQRSECAVGYILAEDRYVYIVGYADLPTVLEYAGNDAEVYFNGGAFCFERGSDEEFVTKIIDYKAKAFQRSADAWSAAVRNHLPEGAVIAVDESRVFPSLWREIGEKLSGYTVLNGTELFMQARMIKHPDEIAGIEASARCAEDSLMAALSCFAPGMTEYRIGEMYNEELAKRGAKPYFCTVTSDLRAAFSDTTNDNVRPIGQGDMIRFDFGCILNGYCSDLGRFALVGEAKKDAEKTAAYYNAIVAGLDAAIEIAKPGVRAGDLFDCAVEAVRKNGIAHYRRHHVGHGIGLECYDNPTINHSAETRLVENMTFNLETPYYELGWGGMMIEDTFVMEPGGVRMLDRTTRDIIRL